jgi:hypothetical protein
MRLDSAGNLGLGVTSPTQVIDMVGNIQMRASGVLNLNNSDNSNQFYLQNTGGSGANNANLIFQKTNYGEVARIDSSGNLLVDGTTLTNSPSQGAVLGVGSGIAGLFLGHANGTATGNYYATFSYNGGIIGSITQSGTTAVAYNTSSDYRLKNIDGPLTGSGAFIDALKPKVGTWKADGSRFVGFLAHEVQEVSPNSVVGEKDGEQMQAMEYGSAEFIANIIAELQSLRARVAALES